MERWVKHMSDCISKFETNKNLLAPKTFADGVLFATTQGKKFKINKFRCTKYYLMMPTCSGTRILISRYVKQFEL